ncbi:hypothetical protein MAR_027946 [Mya arenaria]|uniref:Uncharacterized protein n=1 Tax=Mya arenaria TaxID=6604 RepID=A0ABY7DF55_MYAAR|nr:hypothetical protein MAR_027946 [Mya arenaria]
MVFYGKGLFLFLRFDYFMMFIYEGTALSITCYAFDQNPAEISTALPLTRFQSTASYSQSSAFPATNLRTTPTSRQTPKRPTTTTTTTTTTTSSSTTQVTTPLTTPPPTTSTLQQHPTPAKTSTIEAKVPDSSLGTTPVLELNITTKKTFSATAIVLISIGFGLFVTVTVPVVIILALKCMSNKQNVDHAANVQMSNIGNNFNSETNSDLQTFPDTDSLRYESLQKRTADDSYTNLQMSTGNQNNHLQHLYVGDSSTAHRNKNVSATTDNESHYENSSSQPLSVNSSPRYESLKSRTECNGCTYSASNEINICSNGSTTGTRLGIRNTIVPDDQIVQCVCDLQSQSPTHITVHYDGPGYRNCGTTLLLNPLAFSCDDGSSSFVLPIARLFFEKVTPKTMDEDYKVNITCNETGEEPPEGTTQISSTLQPTLRRLPQHKHQNHLHREKHRSYHKQQHHQALINPIKTPAKTSTKEPKDPDSSPGTTPVLESNITKTKTFSTTGGAANRKKLTMQPMFRCPISENNYNPETNNDLQTLPDTDSLRYETLQKRTAHDSYTNLQISTRTVGNQPNHLQPFCVGDTSTDSRNENVSATTDNESHYENSSSQPF